MTKIKLLLCLAWLFALPQTITAWNNGDEFTIDGITYHILNVQQATVAVYSTTKTGEVTIPASVFDGKDMTFTVVQIGGTEDGSVNFSGVTAMMLPNTIKSLRDGRWHASITTLHLPASVETLSIRFNYWLPSTLQSFTVDADNPHFKAVDGVLYSKDQKNIYCYPAAKTGTIFTIPDGVTTIMDNCFCNNSKLTKIVIPASVTTIKTQSYHAMFCKNVTEYSVNVNNATYCSVDGVVFTKDQKTLVAYPPAKNAGGTYTVPDDCETIDRFGFIEARPYTINLNNVKTTNLRAFQNAKITSVALGAKFEQLGEEMFHWCYGIKRYTVASGNKHFAAVDGVLFSADKKRLLKYPTNMNVDGEYTIPSGTEVLDSTAFQDTKLKKLVVSASVKEIAFRAIRDNVRLTDISFAENSQLTTIGYQAFWGSVVETISLPASLKEIGNSAFYGCKKLTTVTIAENSQLTTIGNYAFDGCILLESFTFAGTSVLNTIGMRAFSDKPLKSFTIPATVTKIGESAFNGCRQLANVTFPADNVSVLNAIGAGAFANSAFTLTRIPSSVKSIGKEAFWNLNTADTINLSANLQTLSTEAFKGCYSLTTLNVDKLNPNFSSIDGFFLTRDKKTLLICPPGKAQSSSYVLLPPSLTRIGDYAFYQNSKLKSVVIPAKVTSLGKRAFGLCTALNRLVMLCDNPISGDSIAQKLNESTFDDGLTTPTDRRASITLSVRQGKLYDYFGDEFYLNFKSFTPSFDYAGGEFMELDAKKHMFVAPKNDDNTFVIPTSWGTTNPDRVVAIADYAFENASSSIKEVVGPLYLEYIGAKAFMTDPAANSSTIENIFLLNGDYQGNKFTNSTYATTRFELDETGHDYSEFAPTTKVFLKKGVVYSTAFLFSSKRYLLDVKTSLGQTVRKATPKIFDYKIPFQVNSTYSTFCREFPTDFSEFNFSNKKPNMLNVIAFTAGKYLKKQWLNGEQVNLLQMRSINESKDGDGVVIPTNTGVVIKTTDGKTPEDYFYQIYEDPTFETYFNEYDESSVVRGIIKRSQTVQPTEGNLVNFILSGDRLHRMTVAREIPVHRSYVQVFRGDLQDGAATIMKFFDGDEEELLSTGLETIEQAAGNDVVYDLQGLPVRQPRKGVYIKNGKKVVVK